MLGSSYCRASSFVDVLLLTWFDLGGGWGWQVYNFFPLMSTDIAGWFLLYRYTCIPRVCPPVDRYTSVIFDIRVHRYTYMVHS